MSWRSRRRERQAAEQHKWDQYRKSEALQYAWLRMPPQYKRGSCVVLFDTATGLAYCPALDEAHQRLRWSQQYDPTSKREDWAREYQP